MNYLSAGDIIFKIKDRARDYLIRIYWKIMFSKLGKGSFVKRGVKISGNPKRISVGKNFKIWENCYLGVGKGKIVIGNDGLLGVNTYINSSEGKIIIGNHVAIAPYCQFYTYSHHYDGVSKVTEIYKIGDIIIEDNVLIGSNVIILPGVTIHKNAVVAAGAIVTKNIESNSIVGGIPAVEIGKVK